MRIVICLDEQKGYMFNNRRQSMDRVLRKKLLEYLDGKPLWMSEYTRGQFTEEGNYVVDDEYLQNAPLDAYCFIEDKGYALDGCDEILVFHWNVKYPFDKAFKIDLEAEGFVRKSSRKFEGSSHDKITFEVYKKRL